MFETKGKKIATRQGFGEGLFALGKVNKKVVALSADVTGSVSISSFAAEFPERFVQVGIAEQNLITIAGGMALSGLIPFACAYSMFITGRPWDQIRNAVCYSDLNVKIAGSHSGTNVGPDGATHQSLEDIAIMRVIPNMTVLVPCDAIEARKAAFAAAEHRGPVFIRLSRTAMPLITNETSPFIIGKANCMKEGSDAAIIACGTEILESLKAAETLSKEGIQAGVYNMHTIKPLDKEAIINAAKQCGCVVTAEDHQKAGGLGSAVAEVLTAEYPVPQEMVGIDDCFGESGDCDELIKCYSIAENHICAAVKKAIQRKK
ncbi:MAG: transketolase C-terminal domain-containing protein [bacterium]